MTETLEHTARRIAERGRDALVERLRPAFAEAAAEHADVLKLDDTQLESMVQRAADRADGLQWRRALAGIATEELGIGLGEALGHPAVARAQAIVGAPSYEESLEKLGEGREDTTEPDDEAEAEAAPEPEAAPETDERELAPEPETENDERELAPEPEAHVHPPLLRLPAIHLGGIGNLTPAEGDIELQFSAQGLDIVRSAGRTPLGRLHWSEITGLDVPVPRGMRRRRRQSQAQFVLRTAQGDASFEIPEMTSEELEHALAPLREQLDGA